MKKPIDQATRVPSQPRRRQARRDATETLIKDAVWSILTEQGFSSLRINEVARKAAVSKELIYRYFGDLPSLVLAAIGDRDYWLTERIALTAASHADKSLIEMTKFIIADHASTLRRDPKMQEIRRWELVSDHPAAKMLARQREEKGRPVAQLLEGRHPSDPAAILGLVTAGLSYLILRSNMLESYLGVDLRDEDGWKRWMTAANTILEEVFKEPSGKPR